MFGFVTKHMCDRQTDRQNYDSQDRASMAVCRGKNEEEILADETHCPDGIRMHSPLCFGLDATHQLIVGEEAGQRRPPSQCFVKTYKDEESAGVRLT